MDETLYARVLQDVFSSKLESGRWGRDRTYDLLIQSQALLPAELPTCIFFMKASRISHYSDVKEQWCAR